MKNAYYFFILFIVLCSGCSQKTSLHSSNTTIAASGLIHTVYFWLNDSVSQQEKLEFEQALRDLSKVPSIHKYYWGKPAKTAERPVTDQSYDYAINVFFSSTEQEAKYQIDPLHLKFVDRYENCLSR